MAYTNFKILKSFILATLYEASIIFGKESFTSSKKALNFIESLINGKEVIKFLTALHTKHSNTKTCQNFYKIFKDGGVCWLILLSANSKS